MSAALEDRIRSTLRAWADEVQDVTSIDDPAAGGGTGAEAGAPGDERGPAPVSPLPAPDPVVVRLADRSIPSRARIVLAVAAAAVVVVVALAILRPPLREVETTTGPGVSAPARAPGPRYVATALPEDYAPRAATDNPRPFPIPADEPAATVQTFRVGAGSITLVARPVSGPMAIASEANGSVRGHPTFLTATETVRTFRWEEDLASMSALSRGLDDGQTAAALNALVARSDDPVDGFDPGAAADPSFAVQLTAERVWPRGSVVPAWSSVSYAAAGATEPTLAVWSQAATGSVDLALVAAETKHERRVIAGIERVEIIDDQTTFGPGPGTERPEPTRTIAWFAPDGTFVTVGARGLSTVELDAVVAGVGPADAATWAGLGDRISASVGALPVATTARWGDVELTIRGAAREADAVPGEWQPTGACIRVGDGPDRCGPFERSGGTPSGPMVVSPAGWTAGGVMVEGGSFLATVTDGSTWWVLGVNEMNEAVQVAVGEEPVADQWSSRVDQPALVFAARLPGRAPSATLTFGYLHVPNGTEVPQTGVPEWREQRRDVDRPPF